MATGNLWCVTFHGNEHAMFETLKQALKYARRYCANDLVTIIEVDKEEFSTWTT